MAIYDESLYDNDVYDDQDIEPVVALLSFGWNLEPLPEEDVPAKLAYTLKIQGTDENNLVGTQAEVDAEISLDMDVNGDENYKVPAGAVDLPLHVLDGNVDVVVLIPKIEMTVKFNSVSGTPFTIRAKGAMLVDAKDITAIFVSNAGAVSNIRLIQGSRQGA